MEEFLKVGGAILLWAIFSLIGRAGEKSKGKGGAQSRAPSRPLPERAGTREPTTLDELLAEMRGQLETAKQHAEVDEDGEWEEESLEAEPQYHRPEGSETWNEIPSPENASWNDPVIVVSRDDEGRLDVARRLAEAEARNRAWQVADHKAFDIKIRAPRPVRTDATQQAARLRLREAIILREVLGPPKGLQDL